MIVFRWVCLALLLLLTGGLTSCDVLAQTPPEEAVRLAIAQQLTQTQQALAQDLGLASHVTASDPLKPNFKIEKIAVRSREKVTDSAFLKNPNLSEVYKVKGTFDATLSALKGKKTQPQSPFEIYLGTHKTDSDDVETWYLIPAKSVPH